MLIRKPSELRYSDITPKATFLDRRRFLAALPAALLARRARAATTTRFANLKASPLSVKDQPNPAKDATTYNNYYEFGTRKNQPVENAKDFKTEPWMLTVEGLVKTPRTFSLEEIRSLASLEERVYRFRCVEGWSDRAVGGLFVERAAPAREPRAKGRVCQLRNVPRSRPNAARQVFRTHAALCGGLAAG
jgi:methionine sulfoxide reductase catalytic subunit